MKFKVGDKIMVIAPGWHEECIVHKMGISHIIMFVRRANGSCPAIYKSWASKSKPKGQQLLFEFVE